MKHRRALIALLGLTALIALAALTHHTRQPVARPAPVALATTTSTRPISTTSSVPVAAQINRQDHYPPALARRQAAAMAARSLLPALPLTYQGVTIAIAGLAPDGRTTLLDLTDGHLGRAHAMAVYRHELAVYGDTGHAYHAQVAP